MTVRSTLRSRLLVPFLLAAFAVTVDAGTTVIRVETEPGGDLHRVTGEVNANGAAAWDGSQWLVNTTYGHMYFTDVNTGARLKSYTTTTFQGNTPETVSVPGLNREVTRSLYTYQKAVAGGVYTFQAVQYRIRHTLAAVDIILRSRGTGAGTANPYFDIYIQDEVPSGKQITAIRGDPVWFTYTAGMEDALAQTSPTAGRTGHMPTANANYFFDVDGGSDMGGWTYQFRAAALAVADPGLSLGSTLAVEFSYKGSDGSGNLRELRFLPWAEGTFTPTAAGPTIDAVVSAASFAGGGVAPGEIVSVFGTGLGPATGVANSGWDPGTGKLPTSLGGVGVTFDGHAAPLFYVVAGQLNVQVPYEVAGRASVNVVVTYQGASSAALNVPVVASHPGVFVHNDRAIVTDNATGALITAQNPMPRGGDIVVWATGPGVVAPAVTTGAPVATLSYAANPQVWIGGSPVEVQFAGMTPGLAGLMQVNLRIPAGAPTGPDVPLKISINGIEAQAYLGGGLTSNLTVAIQ